MAVTFDPVNLLIVADAGTTSINVAADMYSRWKDWVLIGSNAKYPRAFSTVGGDPTTAGNSIASYFFLANGWKLRPQEASHTLVIDGILLTEDQSSPYVSTVGTFNVSIQAVIPLQAESILVETGVSGLTAPESAQLDEVEGLSYVGAKVYIDILGGSAGNTFPSGNTSNPVNNWNDASVIASGRGFQNFSLEGALTLGALDDYDDTHWEGISPANSMLTLSGADSTGCTFDHMKLEGTFAGKVTAERCSLGNLVDFQGTIKECGLTSSVTVDSTATGILGIVDCKSLVAGTGRPTLDINGSSVDVNIRGYTGGLTVENFTAGGNMSIDVISGIVEIASSCTSGTVVVRGICQLIDNSGVGVTVVTEGLASRSIELAPIKTSTDRLDGLVEDVSGDRFTSKALEQAPSGGGGTDVNVISVGGTGVTGPDDLKADVSALATQTSIDALNDFNPATDTVANVTNVSTNADMRGTDGANTVAPDNAGILSAISGLTDVTAAEVSTAVWGAVSRSLTDKTDFDLTTAAKDQLVVDIEAALINEGDGQQLIDAIIQVINSNLDLPLLELQAIASQVRTELATELARIDATISSRSTFDSSSEEVTTDAASRTASKADVSGLATQASIDALNDLSAAQIDARLNAYGAPTLAQMTTAFSEIKGAGWTTDDTLEAIKDAASTGSFTVADIWSHVTRTVTGGTIDTNNDMRGTDGANITAPDNASITSILSNTNRVNLLIEDNGGDRFTAKALETSPTAEMDESELHAALDNYANKDSWQADISALASSAEISSLNNLSVADIDARLASYGAPTLTEMTAAFTEIKGPTWDSSNTLEAITDAVDSLGASSLTAVQVWEHSTRELTAGTRDAEIDTINAATSNLPLDPASKTDVDSVPQQVWEFDISNLVGTARTISGIVLNSILKTAKLINYTK